MKVKVAGNENYKAMSKVVRVTVRVEEKAQSGRIRGNGYLPLHEASLLGMDAEVRYTVRTDLGIIRFRGSIVMFNTR